MGTTKPCLEVLHSHPHVLCIDLLFIWNLSIFWAFYRQPWNFDMAFKQKKRGVQPKHLLAENITVFFLMGQQSVESVVILRWKWFRPNKGNCLPMMKTSSCGTVADPTSHWHILTCSDLLNSIGDGSAVTQPSCHTAGPVLRQVLQAQRAPDRIGTLLDQRRWTIAQLGSSFDQRK